MDLSLASGSLSFASDEACPAKPPRELGRCSAARGLTASRQAANKPITGSLATSGPAMGGKAAKIAIKSFLIYSVNYTSFR